MEKKEKRMGRVRGIRMIGTRGKRKRMIRKRKIVQVCLLCFSGRSYPGLQNSGSVLNLVPGEYTES